MNNILAKHNLPPVDADKLISEPEMIRNWKNKKNVNISFFRYACYLQLKISRIFFINSDKINVLAVVTQPDKPAWKRT